MVKRLWQRHIPEHYAKKPFCGNSPVPGFDDKNTRTARKEIDRFCLIRDIWDAFVRNCQGRYNPSVYLTIDEQLFATKARCPFTQYTPAKPGKFGIKFWLLADAEARYVVNAKPYLGKNYDDNRGSQQLGEYVVMTLSEPYLHRGHNITTDNFFTSKKLADRLLEKKTTLVGTVKAKSKRTPTTVH